VHTEEPWENAWIFLQSLIIEDFPFVCGSCCRRFIVCCSLVYDIESSAWTHTGSLTSSFVSLARRSVPKTASGANATHFGLTIRRFLGIKATGILTRWGFLVFVPWKRICLKIGSQRDTLSEERDLLCCLCVSSFKFTWYLHSTCGVDSKRFAWVVRKNLGKLFDDQIKAGDFMILIAPNSCKNMCSWPKFNYFSTTKIDATGKFEYAE
jgi:hypothetical protein